MEGTDFISMVMRLPPAFRFLACSLSGGHLGVKIEQLFQTLGIVLEAAADINALQNLVVTLMRRSQVGWHVVGVVEIGDCGREMVLARQQDVLSAAREISLVLVSKGREQETYSSRGYWSTRIASPDARRRWRSKHSASLDEISEIFKSLDRA